MANGGAACLLPPPPCSCRPRPKPGGFLTEHDDIPLQEGASENKADFIRVVGSDESRLAVPEAVGPVLELIEVDRCTRVCSGGESRSAPCGGAGWGSSPPARPDFQTYGGAAPIQEATWTTLPSLFLPGDQRFQLQRPSQPWWQRARCPSRAGCKGKGSSFQKKPFTWTQGLPP